MNKKTLLLISTLLAPAMSHGGWFDAVTLSTGAVINVPLFIEQGEKIRVDTRSGEYMTRV